jgi:hypothetical protein
MTGALGEIWYTEDRYRKNTINAALKRWDTAGHGLAEWRLATGFIQLPIPYLGARRREDIHHITHSPEMDGWRLKNSYDRPIPRRLAEEAGVPRHMFGQKKFATVVEFPQPAVPRGTRLKAEFFDYLVAKGLCSRLTVRGLPFVLRFNEARAYYSPHNRYRAFYYLERLVARLLRKDDFKLPRLLRRLDGALFCYCVNKRAQEYGQMLDDAGAVG